MCHLKSTVISNNIFLGMFYFMTIISEPLKYSVKGPKYFIFALKSVTCTDVIFSLLKILKSKKFLY